MKAQRLFFLQYGAERVSKALSIDGGDHHLYWEPLFGALVETADGWILLDTGMSAAALADDGVQHAYELGAVGASNYDSSWHLDPQPSREGFTWGLPGDPLTEALRVHGLTPADIALAAVSHLHVDHSGGIATLSQSGVPVVLQRHELEFARSGAVDESDGFYSPDWTDPTTQWRLVEGSCEIAPGVAVISTPGHTPGHQSFRVELPETGVWLLAGDAADLAQNFLDRKACGSYAGGAGDRRLAYRSLEALLAEARHSHARLIPGHDQLMLNAIGHPRGGHR